MIIDIAVAFTVLIGALILFAYELYPIDFVAICVLAIILVLSPVLNMKPMEAICGFSNPAITSAFDAAMAI